MASLNLELEYFSHPKVIRLICLLGRGAEVLPLRLWAYCGKYHAQDGRLTGYSGQEIEARIEWWGKTGEAIKALIECGQHIGRLGFLESLPNGGYQCHDWLEHQGHIIVFKERSRMAAKKRWSKILPRPPNNATSIATSNATSNALAVQCSATPKSPLLGNASSIPDPRELSPESLQYLRTILKTDQAVKDSLLSTGHKEVDIDKALGKR